jgi:hypothetical protein
LKALAVGICTEEFYKFKPPDSVGGAKTFKKAATFEELKKYIRLVILDVCHKIQE